MAFCTQEAFVFVWWLQEAVCRCCSHPKPEKTAHATKCNPNPNPKYDFIKRSLSEYCTYGEAVAAFENDPQAVAVCLRSPNGMCSKKWNLCGTAVGLHEAKQTHIPPNRYPRASRFGFKMVTAHTSSDNGSKTRDKQQQTNTRHPPISIPLACCSNPARRPAHWR